MWKNIFFGILKVTEDFGTDPHLHPDPDPLVRDTDPRIRIRIRIRTKMSQIRNTATNIEILNKARILEYLWRTGRCWWLENAESPGWLRKEDGSSIREGELWAGCPCTTCSSPMDAAIVGWTGWSRFPMSERSLFIFHKINWNIKVSQAKKNL